MLSLLKENKLEENIFALGQTRSYSTSGTTISQLYSGNPGSIPGLEDPLKNR